MTTKERRTRELQETREKILDAARDMFSEEGFDAVTMRGIADRIEYTPTAIYHHFKNKNALLTELCMCDFRELARHFNSIAAGDPVQRILESGEAYLRFAEKHPSQYRFMFMTVMPPNLEFDEQYLAEHRGNPEKDAYAFLRAACAEAIERGLIRPEITDPDQLSQVFWSGVHGIISLHIVKGHEAWLPWRDLRSSALLAMRMMVRGVLRDPSQVPLP